MLENKQVSEIIENAILKELEEVVGGFEIKKFFNNKGLAMAFYTPIKNDLNLELHFYKNNNIETYKLVQIKDNGKESVIVKCDFDVDLISKIIE